MKPHSLLAVLSMFAFAAPLSAESTLDQLQRRCAEQERQIEQLEAENEKLRSLVPDPTKPATVRKEPAAKPDATRQSAATYTVRSGDTLSRIARAHDTTPERLASLNRLKNAGMIRPGQKLEIPAKVDTAQADAGAPAKAISGTHVVKDGETFFSIARTYGLGTASLAKSNPDVDPRALQVGQTLQLAAGSVASKPAPKPATPSGVTATAKAAPPAARTVDKPAAAKPEPAPAQPVSNKPPVHSIKIDSEITFGAFAAAHGTDTAKLNALNGLHLEPNTVLAKGSELYVSAQP